MKISLIVFAILTCASVSVFGGEIGIGSGYYVQGHVSSVYIRNGDIALVKIKDPVDGYTVQVWTTAGNKAGLATLLTEKSLGHKVKVIYEHMNSGNHDRADNCWDELWIGWVCNKLAAVETIE